MITSASIPDAGNLSSGSGGRLRNCHEHCHAHGHNSPAITIEPADQAIECHNGTCHLYRRAESAAPLSYQWFYNNDTLLADQTNATLTVSNMVIADTGEYKVVVSNSAGPVTSRNALLVVKDRIAPVIALTGPGTIQVECHGAFADRGATASDSCAGDLTSQIITTGSVNPDLPGPYLLRYNVSDPAGNSAVEVMRTVNVVDTVKPLLTLVGKRFDERRMPRQLH